jgi:hypothetical protein
MVSGAGIDWHRLEVTRFARFPIPMMADSIELRAEAREHQGDGIALLRGHAFEPSCQ